MQRTRSESDYIKNFPQKFHARIYFISSKMHPAISNNNNQHTTPSRAQPHHQEEAQASRKQTQLLQILFFR